MQEYKNNIPNKDKYWLFIQQNRKIDFGFKLEQQAWT